MVFMSRIELKKLLLTIGLTLLITYACVELASHLFWCYYREQWGSSAWIMHSPPYGKNYTNKLAIVRTWATYAGIIFGLVANALIGGLIFRKSPAEPVGTL